MRLRVYAIGRSSQYRSIGELESISRGEPFLDSGDDAMHENEAEVSRLFVPFSSVLVELSMKTKRSWHYLDVGLSFGIQHSRYVSIGS